MATCVMSPAMWPPVRRSFARWCAWSLCLVSVCTPGARAEGSSANVRAVWLPVSEVTPIPELLPQLATALDNALRLARDSGTTLNFQTLRLGDGRTDRVLVVQEEPQEPVYTQLQFWNDCVWFLRGLVWVLHR